jgi:hypothetical protein
MAGAGGAGGADGAGGALHENGSGGPDRIGAGGAGAAGAGSGEGVREGADSENAASTEDGLCAGIGSGSGRGAGSNIDVTSEAAARSGSTAATAPEAGVGSGSNTDLRAAGSLFSLSSEGVCAGCEAGSPTSPSSPSWSNQLSQPLCEDSPTASPPELPLIKATYRTRGHGSPLRSDARSYRRVQRPPAYNASRDDNDPARRRGAARRQGLIVRDTAQSWTGEI